MEKIGILGRAVNFVPQRYWQLVLKVCVFSPRFQESPTWAGRGRSLFCDGFGISDVGVFWTKPSTLLGHGGVLPPLTAKSSVLDGLLQRY